MTELDETARVLATVAFHEFERTLRQWLIRPSREHARERLITQVQNLNELTIATDTTALDRVKSFHEVGSLSAVGDFRKRRKVFATLDIRRAVVVNGQKLLA